MKKKIIVEVEVTKEINIDSNTSYADYSLYFDIYLPCDENKELIRELRDKHTLFIEPLTADVGNYDEEKNMRHLTVEIRRGSIESAEEEKKEFLRKLEETLNKVYKENEKFFREVEEEKKRWEGTEKYTIKIPK